MFCLIQNVSYVDHFNVTHLKVLVLLVKMKLFIYLFFLCIFVCPKTFYFVSYLKKERNKNHLNLNDFCLCSLITFYFCQASSLFPKGTFHLHFQQHHTLSDHNKLHIVWGRSRDKQAQVAELQEVGSFCCFFFPPQAQFSVVMQLQ